MKDTKMFLKERLGVFPKPTPAYEQYLQAWLAYHRAADAIDGHVRTYDPVLGPHAVKAGFRAMEEVIHKSNCPLWTDKTWRSAREEALRIHHRTRPGA